MDLVNEMSRPAHKQIKTVLEREFRASGNKPEDGRINLKIEQKDRLLFSYGTLQPGCSLFYIVKNNILGVVIDAIVYNYQLYDIGLPVAVFTPKKDDFIWGTLFYLDKNFNWENLDRIEGGYTRVNVPVCTNYGIFKDVNLYEERMRIPGYGKLVDSGDWVYHRENFI